MVFNSTNFLLFLAVVAVLHFALPARLRGGWMLLASLWFVGSSGIANVLLLILASLMAYGAGLLMTRSHKAALLIGVGGNLAMLCTSAKPLFALAGVPFALPLGLSFFTFQNIGYVLDVHWGKHPAERSFMRYLLFASFFPKLTAGPIERASRLLPQCAQWADFSYANSVAGLRLILWGMFKKVFVADRLSILVGQAYGNVEAASGLDLALATVLFAFQIYGDFSGYSDMAVGIARLFGVDLMVNFKRPYFACSLTDFWRRWHISLSSWFRDYLYIPLGGSRAGEMRHYANLCIVFVLSGVWHGASWTFVIWGAIHAVLICVESMTHSASRTTMKPLRMMLVFTAVCLSWVFFRADSVDHAWQILHKIASAGSGPLVTISLDQNLAFGLTGMFSLLLIEAVQEAGPMRLADWQLWPRPARWAGYHALFWAIVLLGVFNRHEFIYRNF